MQAGARAWIRTKPEVLIVQAQVDVRSPMSAPDRHGTSAPQRWLPRVRRSAVTPSADRALALIVKTMDEPLSVTRLAMRSGLSKRTLHRVVRREFGLSPMALSRRIRLREVRAELEAPRQDTTVTVAAFRWGFTHLGRFAGEYARVFGERPSDTLRRARDEGGRHTALAS
jgi:transcriptional regulator GlxA family with amidase domain